MSDVAIRVESLGKQYRIGKRESYSTLRDSLANAFTAPWRWLKPKADGSSVGSSAATFWALRDVAFEVPRGEVVGIIGRNGAGKSTLLKVLSQITEPTEGQVELNGRVGSLLEVGTGFHPELTGRENIYLNGAILGMKRAEINRKFAEIVAFAEVEAFMDTPVKHYSSGMYMRLAFAVAAHLEPEILVVDEVLAVGDAAFQKKCLGKMKDVTSQGRTVLFVSHNMQAIANLCKRSLCLDQGRVAHYGDLASGVSQYYASMARKADGLEEESRRLGSGEVRFVLLEPEKHEFRPAEEKAFRFEMRSRSNRVPRVYLSCLVIDESGAVVAHCDSRFLGVEANGGSEIKGRFTLRLPWLKPGEYSIDFYACAIGMGIVDRCEKACPFRVLPILPYLHAATGEAISSAPVLADFDWQLS